MTREEAIKILSNRDGHGIPSGYNGGYAEAIEVAVETLKAEPTKHGRWIEVQRINPTDRMAICECSLCGDTVWVYDGQRTWNYCPNCGADMREVEE